MKLLITILVTFFAGMGAGLGTGFAGMSAAAVISPNMVLILYNFSVSAAAVSGSSVEERRLSAWGEP